MKIRMTVEMSGTRNGQPWPRRGETADLPAQEATHLCASGMAVPMPGDTTETAVPPKAEERAETTARKRTRRKE